MVRQNPLKGSIQGGQGECVCLRCVCVCVCVGGGGGGGERIKIHLRPNVRLMCSPARRFNLRAGSRTLKADL